MTSEVQESTLTSLDRLTGLDQLGLTEFDNEKTDLKLEKSFYKNSSKFGIFQDFSCLPSENGAGFGPDSLHDLVTENLNEQIRELRDVNARLKNTVFEKDHEISQLRRTIASASDSSEKESSGWKIIELAKTKRELTAKFEAEHSRFLKIYAEKAELETRLAHSDDKNSQAFRQHEHQLRPKPITRPTEKKFIGEDNDVATLHHRLQASFEKTSVSNQENQCLKQQLQKTIKALEREVGPNVDISDIIKGSHATYRGRDQQIQLLRTKLETVQKQLDAFRLFDKNDIDLHSVRTIISSKKLGRKPEQNEYNARHRDQLNQDDQKRRAEFMTLTEEHQRLQQSYSELKSKMAAAKARIDYLSKENLRLSQFNRHILDTCKKDSELIRYFQTTITDLRVAFSKTSLPASSALVNMPCPFRSKPISVRSSSNNSHRNSNNQSNSNSHGQSYGHSFCSTDQTIFGKISKMENELKNLKEVHSLTFDQISTTNDSGGVVFTSRSESEKSCITKKSAPFSRGSSFGQSKSKMTNFDKKQESPRETQDSLDGNVPLDHNPDREAGVQLMSFEKTKQKCENVSEKLPLMKENFDLLRLQVENLETGREINVKNSVSSKNFSFNLSSTIRSRQNKKFRPEIKQKIRPAFSCYAR